eukprot:9493829-Pyramimonas_sp.AAC.1
MATFFNCAQYKTRHARVRASARTRNQVTRARAGHPKSRWSPLRVHFSFQIKMAAYRVRRYKTRHARVRARAIGWTTRDRNPGA